MMPDLTVVDVTHAIQLPEDAVVYVDVRFLDALSEAIESLRSVVGKNKSGAMQGALVLPGDVHLYQYKVDLEAAAEDSIFSVVRPDTWTSAEDIVRKAFTISETTISQGQQWTEDLHALIHDLPLPKGFNKDPDLDEYFN